jgi:hypothetical protein
MPVENKVEGGGNEGTIGVEYSKVPRSNVGENQSTRESKYEGDENSSEVETIDIKDPKYKVRADKARFPVSIVWTPLPCLT